MSLAGLTFCLALSTLANQAPEKVASSGCHVFIDFKNIWTVEVTQTASDYNIPILNIVTFDQEEVPLRPRQIHIRNREGDEAEVERLAIDTGVEGDPHITNYLKILKSSFIGMDLVGNFSAFAEPAEVMIELGRHEFVLQAVDCMDFEGLVERINQINFNSPDIREDFEILDIETIGSRRNLRRGRQ